MVAKEKLLGKLQNLTLKKAELATLLNGLGFIRKPGKGSHEKWVKKGFPPVILATHDKEVKPYQLRQVIQVLKLGGIL
ncbi:MAG: type II toxin-antitoxin system HicA family toxin [Deltaproteobacteria bacterium]|nr:type II toxin-antitoxin system HicA family toxin [Deltaproteobacteria bacterium]